MNPGSGYASDRFEVTLRQDTVDVLGRPLSQSALCSGTPAAEAWPCEDWLPPSTTNRYNRLGALVVQKRDGAGQVSDTMRFDGSGNMIFKRNGLSSQVTTFHYPSASNRLQYRRDSVENEAGGINQAYLYDASGSRLMLIKPGRDSTYWQYDVLSRLVGTAHRMGAVTIPTHFNECRWDASWRLAQPCGSGGQLAFMGQNAARSSLGWFFVQAPGLDESVLLINRNDSFVFQKRLQAVTDGRGQLLAIADSLGDITSTYAGSGYDQAAWKTAGLTTRAQTFDQRKWETDDEWGGVQQFRNRAYDPATGAWIQEDPIGVAGGVNVYRFNNGNPAAFSDPFGMCPEEAGGDGKTDRYDDCPVGSSGYYAYLAAEGDSSLVNEIHGLIASCKESTVCAIGGTAAAMIVAGGARMLADEAVTMGRGVVQWLNTGRYLRVGIGGKGGRRVFRIAGEVVGWFKKNPHIDLWDFGPK
jgi:RHS repeat-associated protein